MSPRSRILAAVVVVAVIGGGAGAFFWWQRSHNAPPSPSPAPVVAATPAPAPSPTPTQPPPPEPPVARTEPPPKEEPAPKPAPVHHHRPEAPRTIEEAVRALVGQASFKALFYPEDFARRFVVTVDKLPDPLQSRQDLWPLVPPKGAFAVTGRADSGAIDPANFKRYSPYAALARAVDGRAAVAVYSRFRALFQAAYRELGKDGDFSDRLVEVIDDLLAAPEPRDPPAVSRPDGRFRYKYVSDDLESLSAGQKILVRMGRDNERLVKVKLRDIREPLARLIKDKE